MKHRRSLHRRYGRALWSARVRTHHHTPEGLFTKSAHTIARTLRAGASDAGQAIKRLTFYMNRAGHNLTAKTHAKLRHALRILERGL